MASKTEDLGRGHAERLMGMIAEVLTQAGQNYNTLTGIAVCVGPGSFTGIRVALATATGLSIVLKIPVTGVSAFQALALEAIEQQTGKSVAAIIDAHRGDIYLQNFGTDAFALNAPRQISIENAAILPELRSALLIGNGAPLLTGLMPEIEICATTNNGITSVDAVAKAALNPAMTIRAKPLYLRRPDAKPQEAYTLARSLR